MHLVLLIPELVDEIFDNLTRLDLTRAALTCKALSVPAIRAIWSKHGSFQALVALLPPDAILSEQLPIIYDINWLQVLLRPIAIMELSPLLERLPFIRQILYTAAEEKAHVVFNALARLFPEHDFFPAMRELSIQIPICREPRKSLLGWYNTPQYLLPKIQSLVIRNGVDIPLLPLLPFQRGRSIQYEIHSLLRGVAIHTGTGALRSLTLEFSTVPFQTHEGLGEAEKEFVEVLRVNAHSLRFLSYSNVPTLDMWEVIVGFPNLTELIVGHSSLRDHGQGVHLHQSDYFKRTMVSLQELTIGERAAVPAMVNLLERCYFPELRTVNGWRRLDNEDFPSEFLRVIGSNAPNLQILKLDASLPSFGPPMNWQVLSGNDFAPLIRSCQFLEHLEISPSTRLKVELTNDDVAAMATAWPRLTVLSLPSIPPSSNSKVTLEGLIPFAQSCRNLVVLRLGLDATTPHILYSKEFYLAKLGSTDTKTNGSIVHELDVGVPQVHDAEMCAEFLVSIFPSLGKIAIPRGELGPENQENGARDVWREVVERVDVLQKPRVSSTVEPEQSESPLMLSDVDDDDQYYYYEDESVEDDDADYM